MYLDRDFFSELDWYLYGMLLHFRSAKLISPQKKYHAYIDDTNLPSVGNWGSNFVSFAKGDFIETIDIDFTVSSMKGVNFKGFCMLSSS